MIWSKCCDDLEESCVSISKSTMWPFQTNNVSSHVTDDVSNNVTDDVSSHVVDDVRCHVTPATSALMSSASMTNAVGCLQRWRKLVTSVTKTNRHWKINTVNGAVRTVGRWRIMTKTRLHPWPTRIVIDWNCFHDDVHFVTEYLSIRDENVQFVTIEQMWRSYNDEVIFVTKTSQMNICDDIGIFSDERWTSSMWTSLLVGCEPLACCNL